MSLADAVLRTVSLRDPTLRNCRGGDPQLPGRRVASRLMDSGKGIFDPDACNGLPRVQIL